MIRHTVTFKLTCAENSVEEQRFYRAAIELAHIAGVQNFEYLKQVNKKNNFDFGISMEFEDQQVYDAYSNHPSHLHFVQEYWLKWVADFLEIDYEPLP